MRCGTGRSGDAGSYTLLAAVLALMLLLLAGLVFDGGAKLRAGQRADDLAQEAARAGAGQIDRSRAYASGTFAVDSATAVAAARAYLRAAGHEGTVAAVGAHQIKVTVTVHGSTALLSLIGIDSLDVTRSATADLLSGVEGPGK
jgi:Flp pilus assembly protein TadG